MISGEQVRSNPRTMRRRPTCTCGISLCLLLSVFLWISRTTSDEPDKPVGFVAGTVLNPDTGEPWPDRAVMIRSEDSVLTITFTDSVGDYGTYLAPGTYRVSVTGVAEECIIDVAGDEQVSDVDFETTEKAFTFLWTAYRWHRFFILFPLVEASLPTRSCISSCSYHRAVTRTI